MQQGDILMKKWCFGIGRAKPRKMVGQNTGGEAQTYITYPKYRTIVLKIESAEKKGKVWHVTGQQYASLTGKPKTVNVILEEKGKKRPLFVIGGQKRPFHLIPMAEAANIVTEEGMPPVGSLISVNKKHALVVETGRNQLTVFVNGSYETLTVKPGSVKWFSDKILSNMAGK
tara:strand:+ start:167 stop:682 length:516 start_codon:yes stop_codon:yes gene_type:complete